MTENVFQDRKRFSDFKLLGSGSSKKDKLPGIISIVSPFKLTKKNDVLLIMNTFVGREIHTSKRGFRSLCVCACVCVSPSVNDC